MYISDLAVQVKSPAIYGRAFHTERYECYSAQIALKKLI
jgi:hypothetical protein